MAIKTYTEQLEEVQAAITAVLTGTQSHSINGRAMTRADLGTLYQMQERLMPKATKEGAGRKGARVRYFEAG